jgi:hypothetical protein
MAKKDIDLFELVAALVKLKPDLDEGEFISEFEQYMTNNPLLMWKGVYTQCVNALKDGKSLPWEIA